MITADQLVAHAVGDYLLQSDWMATEKTKKTFAALAHAATYTLPFLALSRSLAALAVVLGTHFIIDRWRLARYVVWVKNWLAPKWFERGDPNSTTPITEGGLTYERVAWGWNKPWKACQATGYDPDRPAWLTVWLLIIADNTMHVLCNGLALHFLG